MKNQEKNTLDTKLDKLERDIREYRRIIEENPKRNEEIYTEENLNMIITEITEKKDIEVSNN